jgi:transposase
MISKEQEAEILRLFHAEGWKPNEMATQLGLHHDAVERVLEHDGTPRASQVRKCIADSYIPFIKEQLEKHPKLRASRLWRMCKERGYRGQQRRFRAIVERLRPRPSAEAYLRLKTLPGEQAQVDWAHFGKVQIGRALRPLVAFVMVLSWSRMIFLRFFLGLQIENFLRGHEAAFHEWAGLARVHLYDNLKSAVLERFGQAIRFNPTLLAFASHYRYEPRPVAPYRGNEKARVERAIRYVRDSFFAARQWRDLDALNHQAIEWCNGEAAERPWPEDPRRTVGNAFLEEQERLLQLPGTSFPVDERIQVRVGKTPYVRFDLNDYSIPHTHVRRTLYVVADLNHVRVLDGQDVIASHFRSFDKGSQIEDPAHVQGLVDEKRQARKHRGIHRLAHAAPSSEELLGALALRGDNLRAATGYLLRLLDTYGAQDLEHAIKEALTKGVPHPHAVRLVLERQRLERGEPPVMALNFSSDPRIRDITVRPHDLKTYDSLANPKPTEDDDDEENLALQPA